MHVSCKGVVVARTLVKTGEDVLPLRIFNPGRRTCVVLRGAMAGTLTSIDEGDVEDPECSVLKLAQQVEVPEHLVDLYRRSKEGVPSEFHDKIAKLLITYIDVFSKSDTDIGRTGCVKHHINTGNARPLKERPRRFPPSEHEEIKRQVHDLLRDGRIEPSDSPMGCECRSCEEK